MIHPATEVRYINRHVGCGLFATRSIPAGTITWSRDQLDREITPEQLLQYNEQARETILHYSYRNNKGNFIFCWDNTRYMNHNCNPNTCITAYEVEIAVRDIHAGEEVTNHYGMLNILEPFELADEKRTIIRPDDLLRHGKTWDNNLERVFPLLTRVDQPLRSLLSDEQWDTLCSVQPGGMRHAVCFNVLHKPA